MMPGFREIIRNFRSRDVEHLLRTGEEVETHPDYQVCLVYVEENLYDESRDWLALRDLLEHGSDGDGYINARLLARLADACRDAPMRKII